jgi:hypothetical protein
MLPWRRGARDFGAANHIGQKEKLLISSISLHILLSQHGQAAILMFTMNSMPLTSLSAITKHRLPDCVATRATSRSNQQNADAGFPLQHFML